MFRIALIAACICLIPMTALAFDLQGHRGARGLMPENTLPAFAKALSIGVSTLEFDTGVTKDGIVVVSHNPEIDPNITRDEAGNWVSETEPLNELTFEKLQTFDVGKIKPDSRAAKRFADQVAIDDTRIPSLDEVFLLVKKSNNETVRFNIETKLNPFKPGNTLDPDAFAKSLLAVVAKHSMESRTTIQSFDWRTLQVVQKMNPSIDTVYLTAQQDWFDNVASENNSPSKWTAGFNLNDHSGSVPKLIKAAGGKVWSPFSQDIDAAKVKEAQNLGLKVIPWTVNSKDEMTALIAMGVDGIISDYPDILREVMKEADLPLPEPTPVQP